MSKQVGVIIGGGNGIGASCAKVMAARGWTVVVTDLDISAAQTVAKEVGGHAKQVDISALDAVEQIYQDALADFGSVQGVVVAAAHFQDKFTPEAFPMDLWRRIIQVNLEGAFNVNRVFAAGMAKTGGGSVVNVASINAHASSPQHAYGPTKAAMINMTKNFAAEYGGSGVRVNSVSPGAVAVARVLARPPGRYATNINDHMALGRRVEPDEIGEGVEFLLSGRASAITGVDLIIDAGWFVANSWHLYGGVPRAEH